MINAIKQSNFVYFVENPRQEGTELLYTSDKLSLQELSKIARPWECLWKRDGSYKLSIIQYLDDIFNQTEFPDLIPLEEGDIEREEKRFLDYLGILVSLGSLSEITGREMNPRYQTKYTVDIFTYLSDKYGEALTRKYESLCILQKESLDFLRDLSEKRFRLKYIQENYSKINLEEIIEFFPITLKEQIRIFGIYGESSGRIGKLEFTRPGFLEAPEFPSLREEIRKEFKIGEVWVSGDLMIKERLQRVYDKCGISQTPKIKDLFEFFDIIPTWIGPQRAYRLNYRL